MSDFFAGLFEFWGTNVCPIGDDLYDFVFTTVGIMWLIVCPTLMLVYYKIWDPLKFSSPVNWIVTVILSSALFTIITTFTTISLLNSNHVTASFTDYLPFLVAVFVWSFVLTVASSFVFKMFSRNNRHNPF